MGKQLTGATSSSGDSPLAGENIGDYKGKLFVIEPLEVEKDVETTHGTTDATRANVWVVKSKDGSKFEEFEDILVFQRMLQGQLRRAMGKSVVFGRLAQGEAKKGKNPPWILADPSPADTEAASAFWSARSLSAASSSGGSDDGFDGDDDGDSF